MTNSTEDTVPSPCVGICRMDERTGYCIGCQRTLDEIALWSTSTEAEKRAILQQLPGRQAPYYRLKLY